MTGHSHRFPLVSYQPLRLIYLIIKLSILLARIPLWVIFYALPAGQPHKSWSLRQTLLVRLARAIVDINSKIAVTDKLALTPGREKDSFTIVSPFSASLYQGPLKSKVSPQAIGGTWYPSAVAEYQQRAHNTIVLHVHGGAFVIGAGRTADVGFFAHSMVQKTSVDAVFCPQYRLSGYGNLNPFPSALQDVLTSYLYLTRTLEIPASRIVLSGDSAGGNLVIALLRYLEEYANSASIPKPSSAVLISPWVSLQNSLGPEITFSSNPHWSTDYLPSSFLRWGAETYPGCVPASSPWISPLGSPFKTSVPIIVNIGAAEMFEIDCSSWVREMKSVEGNTVEVNYEANAPHDTPLIGYAIGWEESSDEVIRKIGSFIRAHREA